MSQLKETRSQLEDEITESLAEEFRKTEEFEILCDIMCRYGWQVVQVDLYQPDEEAQLIKWAQANCEGEWRERTGRWLFELGSDATIFKLKWG